MNPDILYITHGKISLKQPNQPARLIESRFGQSLIDRASQIQERNAWKTKGTGAQFMSGRVLWGGNGADPMEMTMAVTGISRGTHSGQLLYSLATDEVTGVFALSNQGAEERRLFHTADFRVSQLSAHPTEDRVACVVQHRDICNIATMRGDGLELTDVTQGDSIDRAPSWVPGSPQQLIYQSSGIARNGQGVYSGLAAARIERLDLESGEVLTILQDETHDFLDPRMDAGGNLYCVRKPYHSLRPRFNPVRALLDLVLFPFRLLFAFFQFMNFFTMRYTGKTLVTSGNVRQKQADLRQMMMLGNLMQAQQEAAHESEHDRDGLVAKSWELIKKSPGGEIQVIEKGVLSFDLCDDGSIVFTDGSHVYLLQTDGKKEELVKDSLISQVVALPS